MKQADMRTLTRGLAALTTLLALLVGLPILLIRIAGWPLPCLSG